MNTKQDSSQESGPSGAQRKSDTTVKRDQDSEPQLPHERDESSQSDDKPRPRIRQAHQDVSRGLVDTDRGPAMDSVYKKQK